MRFVSRVQSERLLALAESSGKVFRWGDNFQGQVGDGTRAARRQSVPVDLPFAALGVSLSHTDVCAWSGDTATAATAGRSQDGPADRLT